MEYFTTFYLDKERDIVVNLYKSGEDELTYIIETPNHNTGNLISNLARICGLETIKNENDMKIIKGIIPASINAKNEDVYIFRLGGYRTANIFDKAGLFRLDAGLLRISHLPGAHGLRAVLRPGKAGAVGGGNADR